MVLMETRVSEQRASRIIQNLGFSNQFIVPSEGQAGALWILWNSHTVSVDIITYSSQPVHAIINFNNTNGWLFLPTYVSPIPAKKTVLWDSFIDIASQSNIPWLVAGDLNDMTVSSER